MDGDLAMGRVPGHRAPLPVGGRPYRGTPSLLRPPLGSVFLHHTLEPARPCRSFGACASAMRDMQRFHQDTRSWDDIGYRSPSPPLVPVTSHGPWHPPMGRVIVPLWALPPPLSPLTVPVTPMGLRHPPWSPSLSPCIPHHCPSTVPSLSLTVPSLSPPLSPHCPLTVPSQSPPLSLTVPTTVPTTVPHCPPLFPTVPSLSPSCPRSFVVGSDRYLYEGQGRHWVGTHAKATTPKASALALSMTSWPPCRTPTPWPWCGTSSCPVLSTLAMSSRTSPCAANTDCPGNALFQEIQSCPGFQGTPVALGLGVGDRWGGWDGVWGHLGTDHGSCPFCSEEWHWLGWAGLGWMGAGEVGHWSRWTPAQCGWTLVQQMLV
uniref:Uncharacterized protein n=1 Tax=Corvus moneduloides TaxID=1196302 RepID=A0A8U7NKS8_CORMO